MPDRISSEQADDLLRAIRELSAATDVISKPFRPPSFWRHWGPTIVGCFFSAIFVAGPSYLALRDRVLVIEQKSQDLTTLRDSVTQQGGRLIKLESSQDDTVRRLTGLEHTVEEIARKVWGTVSRSSAAPASVTTTTVAEHR